MLKIAIMMNNYFHDLATALWLTSGVTVYYLAKTAETTGSREAIRYFSDSYKRLTTLGRVAFIWILAAGVVRILNFESFEWPEAMGKNIVVALVIKHIIMFTAVGLGMYAWLKLNRKVKELRQAYNLEDETESAIVEQLPQN